MHVIQIKRRIRITTLSCFLQKSMTSKLYENMYVVSECARARLFYVMHSSFLGITRVHLSSLHTNTLTSIWLKMKIAESERASEREEEK